MTKARLGSLGVLGKALGLLGRAFPSPALRAPCPPPPEVSPPWDVPQELREEVGRHVNVRRIRDGLILSVWLSDKTLQLLGKPNPPCKLLPRQEGGRKRKTKAARRLFSHWAHSGASLCQLTCPQVREAEAQLGGRGTACL